MSGLAAFPARRASAGPSPAVEGTTLDTTVVRGAADNLQGYVRLASGGGEAHAVRDELGTVARPGREGRRVGLLAFVHLTDIHVIDAQSPGRVEFLDRYNDGPGEPLLFGSAYRPPVAAPGRWAAGSAPGGSVVGGSVAGGDGARGSVAGGSTERLAATGGSAVLTAGAVTATAAALALRANREGAADG